MDSLETVLTKKIVEAEPALDIQGADRKLLQIACQDFVNYVRFNIVSSNQNGRDVCIEKRMRDLLLQQRSELEAFLAVWTGIWLKKWKQRVKLLIGNQNQTDSSKSSNQHIDPQLMWQKLECRREMMDIVVSVLVKNAEVCGTEILAENILKMELVKKADLDINDKEQLMAVLNSSLRRTRELTQGVGPLIYVKVDKNYYVQ